MKDDIYILLIVSTLSFSYYLITLILFPPFIDKLFGIKIEPGPCRVPQLNPFDDAILKFFKKPKNITCIPPEPLVVSDLSHLYIKRNLLQAYNVGSYNDFKCCYHELKRGIPDELEPDIIIMNKSICKPFSYKAKIKSEFVEVNCIYRKKIIYRDMFSFVPIKRNINRNQFSNTNNKQKLNVLIFGIDSVSHMNFQRQMPKTRKYIVEHLNSISMSGFNKVADNTFPNMIPILTGKTVKEFRKTCKSKYSKFDNCHFIWNDFEDAGYLTAFAEDAPDIGLFNLDGHGFSVQPTHYYLTTFNYYAESEIKNGLCLGPRPLHQVLIEYAKKIVFTLKNEPFFGLFWSVTLTHGCFNCPKLSDDDYLEFFQSLKKGGVLNKTVVIFLSDHGLRFDDFLNTYPGYFENKLPFVYFILPDWFNQQYPIAIKNMKDNSNRLTANFDIYETFKDLLDLENLKTKYLINNEETTMGKRGLSLFSVVPDNRTCKMAGIPSHWCSCRSQYEVSTYSTAVRNAAYFIVNSINSLLINNSKCAQLKLKSINSALSTKFSNTDLKEYTVNLKTIPGDAIFEGSVQCLDVYNKSSFNISGSISRLNRYGNQSSCISYRTLKKFCYCI